MNNKDHTLIILTPGFPESEADTTCLPMQQRFIRVLKNDYPELNIIVLAFQYPYHKKKYSWFNIPVIPFSGKNKGGLVRLWRQKKIDAALKEIHQRNKITGLLSFWYGECAWVGKRFADRNNMRHYCWIMGQDAKKGNKYIKYTRLKENEMIALSDFLQDEFERNYGTRPLHVVPPGIDAKQFSHPTGEKDIDIIAAGSLIPLKQFEVFIDIIGEIKKQVPAVKAVLMGDGPEKNKLLALVAAYGLQPNITLTGEMPHPQLLQYMQRAKVLLHPSAYEGFGVVALEALQAGCHVISFCRPVKKEIMHWHIAESKAAMAQKALDILQDPASVYKGLTPFPMGDTVKKIMGLFAR